MAKATSASSAAQGTLHGHVIRVDDTAQANRLHNKGTIGTPRAGNTLELSLVEAAWCVAEGRLTVTRNAKALAAADLIALGADGGERTEVEYLCYRDLRERGLVVRPAPGTSHFNVWPRGTAAGEPAFMNVARSDRHVAMVDDLLQGAAGGIVISVVDDDGGLTHYKLALDVPTGDVPPANLPKAKGRLLADRVVVADRAAAKAYATHFIGKPHEGGAFLSLLEAEALRQRGLLAVDGDVTRKAGAANPAFAATLPVFLDLQSRGVVAKSGFRFGTHLRGYRKAPDDEHAEWLIHCVGPAGLPLSDLSRGVRLAHGVRKKFLIAVPARDGIQYVHVAWFRP